MPRPLSIDSDFHNIPIGTRLLEEHMGLLSYCETIITHTKIQTDIAIYVLLSLNAVKRMLRSNYNRELHSSKEEFEIANTYVLTLVIEISRKYRGQT